MGFIYLYPSNILVACAALSQSDKNAFCFYEYFQEKEEGKLVLTCIGLCSQKV